MSKTVEQLTAEVAALKAENEKLSKAVFKLEGDKKNLLNQNEEQDSLIKRMEQDDKNNTLLIQELKQSEYTTPLILEALETAELNSKNILALNFGKEVAKKVREKINVVDSIGNVASKNGSHPEWRGKIVKNFKEIIDFELTEYKANLDSIHAEKEGEQAGDNRAFSGNGKYDLSKMNEEERRIYQSLREQGRIK